MEQIIYRKLKKKDFAAAEEIISRAFGLSGYISDLKILNLFKHQYLYSCLSEATYTCAAEENGKVVGIIMGKADSDYSIIKHIPYLIKFIYYNIRLKFSGKKCEDGIGDYKRLHEIYAEFSKRHKGEFDGVLTLFALNLESRGKGVGKKLLDGLMNYLNKKNTENIYLYTDTTCNYGFYEHMGFLRLEEAPIRMMKNGKPMHMDVFLYGYSDFKKYV